MMKSGGRCGVVIKNTFLSNSDNASIALRKQLLEECNLFAVLDLPQGAFIGTGVKTVVLFFQKGKPSENVWYYQLDVGRSMGKTKPLNENDLKDFIETSKTQQLTEKSWILDIRNISKETWDLTVHNPNIFQEVEDRTPLEIIEEIKQLDMQANEALQNLKELL